MWMFLETYTCRLHCTRERETLLGKVVLGKIREQRKKREEGSIRERNPSLKREHCIDSIPSTQTKLGRSGILNDCDG